MLSGVGDSEDQRISTVKPHHNIERVNFVDFCDWSLVPISLHSLVLTDEWFSSTTKLHLIYNFLLLIYFIILYKLSMLL